MQRFRKHYGAIGLAMAMGLSLAGAAHAQTADTTNPSVGSVTPTTAQLNVSTSFSATYSDNVGVTSCELFVNGVSQGSMSLNGSTSGTATRSHTLSAEGTYTFQARCRDWA